MRVWAFTAMKALAISILSLTAVLSLQAATIYIGDAAPEGMIVTDQGNPDGANSGNITYGLHENPIVNGPVKEGYHLGSVNFWADGAGTLTPFVAVYNGSGVADNENYTILSVGDAITVTDTGLNNALFTVAGEHPIVPLAAGEILIAGFHQTAGIVPFSGTGGADYLDGGNQIGPVGGNLNADANWSDLTRTYAFNIGTIPEPSRALLILIGFAFPLLFTRRR